MILIALTLAFAFGLALLPASSRLSARIGYPIAAALFVLFLYLIYLVPSLRETPVVVEQFAWLPQLDLSLDMRIDGLSLAFGLLISGIGALVFAYAAAYFKGKPGAPRFLAILLLFTASMLGVVFSDNIIGLFVFWELTSVTSFLLIGYEHWREKARSSALQSLLTTGLGGLALLAGLILLGNAAGTYSLTGILENGSLSDHPDYTAIVALILLAAFTKSAQFPFHYWLPNAMEAPTPASAFLHSSTMVKAGVYLVARLTPALGSTDLWYWTIVGVSLVTMVVASWLALQQTQLKPLLAYTTIIALSTLMLCIGLGEPITIKAAKVFLFVHAFYKAALFMVAGSLIHETDEKDTEKLGGLARLMPWTAAAAGISALSMAGLPPLFGFIGKEAVYEAALFAPQAMVLIVAVVIVANAANVFVAFAVGFRPFLSSMPQPRLHAHEAPAVMVIAPLLLAAVSITIGIVPNILGPTLLSPSGSVILGDFLKVELKRWYGVNLALLLSIGTVLLGTVAFVLRNNVREILGLLASIQRFGPNAMYGRAVGGLRQFSAFQTRVIQHGYLRHYMLVVILSVFLLAGTGLWHHFSNTGVSLVFSPRLYEILLCALMISAAVASMRLRSLLGAIVCVGVVGYGASVIFILYGAPDLAMTQIVIESLAVLLLVLVAYGLPARPTRTSRSVRTRDAIVATFAGAVMGVLAYAAQLVEHSSPVSDFFSENSVSGGYGRNIVNVILVDFRALDTLGEITVLAIAALGAMRLLGLGSKKDRADT